MQKPDNNLVWAILSTVFCCWPFGVVAIIKAASVDSLWYSGRCDEAVQAAADARKWAWVSAGVCLFCVVAYILLLVLMAVGIAALE